MTAPLHCASCGREGRGPTIANEDTRPVLRPAFGWGDPPRTVLLCDLCRLGRPTTRQEERR